MLEGGVGGRCRGEQPGGDGESQSPETLYLIIRQVVFSLYVIWARKTLSCN